MGDMSNSETVQITGTIMVIAIIVLFLVVVFVLFLHVYAKLFWWRVEAPPTPPAGRRRRRHAFQVEERGLDLALLRSLPVMTVQSQEDGLECSVCLSEIVEGERARVLPKCKHGFHLECIDMWFHSHSTCPLCRTSVSPQTTSSVSTSHNNPLSDSSYFPTDGPASEQTTSSSTHHLPSSSTNALLIDVPPQVSDSFGEDESKSPAPTRLRSLKRLLSREWDKRKAPTSSNSADEV